MYVWDSDRVDPARNHYLLRERCQHSPFELHVPMPGSHRHHHTWTAQTRNNDNELLLSVAAEQCPGDQQRARNHVVQCTETAMHHSVFSGTHTRRGTQKAVTIITNPGAHP